MLELNGKIVSERKYYNWIKKENDRLDKERERLEYDNKILDNENERLDAENNRLKNINKELESRISLLKGEKEKLDHHDTLEKLKSENEDLIDKIDDLEKELERKDIENTNLIIKLNENFVMCKRCDKEIFLMKDSYHHIVPRTYNGSDNSYNRIALCDRCHDYVEIKTDEWIKSGRRYDIDILKSMIISDGFDTFADTI